MVVCPTCGHQNEPEARFCANLACGAFLGWRGDETPPQPSAPTGPAPTTGAPPQPGEDDAAARLVAGLPSQAKPTQRRQVVAVLSPESLAVNPGSSASSQLRIENKGNIVDQYAITIDGPAAAWTTVTPPTVNLYPNTSESVTLGFQPPRRHDVPAGPTDLRVVVSSTDNPEVQVVKPGTVQVGAFTEFAADLYPQTSHGRSRASHELIVTNTGNVPLRAEVFARDPNNALSIEAPSEVVADPGAKTTSTVGVRPKKRRWAGLPEQRPFEVRLTTPEAQPVTLNAGMQQMAYLPPWMGRVVPRVLMAVALIGAMLFAVGKLAGNDETTMTTTATGDVTTTTTMEPPPSTRGTDKTVRKPPTTPTQAPVVFCGDGSTASRFEDCPTTPTSGTGPPPPPRVQVPNVAGLSPTEGLSKLQQLGLTAVAGGWEVHPEFVKGRLTRTDPAANTEVGSPSEVKLYQSLGKIAYHTGAVDYQQRDIWLMTPDGKAPIRFDAASSGREDAHPKWSADGTRLALSSRRGDKGDSEIWLINADGTGLRNVTNSPTTEDWAPSWSPMGDKLAYECREIGTANTDICVKNADGSGSPQNLTKSFTRKDRTTKSNDGAPSWSPDGTKIVFASDLQTDDTEIWVMAAPGTSSPVFYRLTQNNGFDSRPVWSPDGQKVAFATNRDGNDELYVMDATGANPTNVSRHGAYDGGVVAWSPDGTLIAFITKRDASALSIYTTNVDGTVQRKLRQVNADFLAW
jgi:TolB protein